MNRQIINNLLLICLLFTAGISFGQGKVAIQKAGDEQVLNAYFGQHNLQPTRTKSGLYYIISQPGAGKNAWRGQTVTVKYKGYTVSGEVFDSSTTANPLVFSVGMGRVIKGWDEGLQLMNKGCSATLFIPSGLAYGEKAMGDKLPPNSILIFDVTLLNIDK